MVTNRFFRGAGATMRLHARLSLTAFGSHRSLDATLTVDEQRGLIPTSLATSGLHRTPNERAKKDAIQETIAGGALEWTQPGLHVGLAGYRGRFAQPLISGSAPYQRFDFAGRTHAVVTAYANATLGSMYAFGELARSEVAWGGIGGVLIDEENADAVVSLRYFPRHFTAPHGQIFGERGDPPQNETGAYIGLRVRPAPKWQLSGYVDQYVFPWLRFAIPRPSTGRDVRFLVEHTPRSWLNYYLQVRTEIREEGTTIETADSRILESLHAAPRQSIRLHGEYAFSPRLRFRMRIEGARHTASDASHTGVLLYQGARWRPASWLRFDTRWTLFDTDGFDARIYTYEHDLLYTFSIPVFSGRGQRYYTLLQLTPMDGLHLELKYGTTRYRDVAAVGSGLDEVEGQRIREVRMQVRWSF